MAKPEMTKEEIDTVVGSLAEELRAADSLVGELIEVPELVLNPRVVSALFGYIAARNRSHQIAKPIIERHIGREEEG
jgi:hypothetical protein